jgi:DNA-directed RNA polymerase subunit RPC12/RpoP
MWSRKDPSAGKPLVHCPECTSRFIYAVDAAGFEGEVILHRRCPECEHRDAVVTTALAAAAWYRRDTRLMGEISVLADQLADEIGPLETARDAETPGA